MPLLSINSSHPKMLYSLGYFSTPVGSYLPQGQYNNIGAGFPNLNEPVGLE